MTFQRHQNDTAARYIAGNGIHDHTRRCVMKKKLIISAIALILSVTVLVMFPAVKSRAAAGECSKEFSFDISGLSEKMQAGAVFSGIEYKDDLYFISDARLYRYTRKQALAGKDPALLINNAVSFRIENDALFYTQS